MPNPLSPLTPGVYLNEFSNFTTAITGVPTSVAAFVGYTEQAISAGKPVPFQPVPIVAVEEFVQVFGGAPKTTSRVAFNLYRSVELFFANGGRNCYVVSVGDYTSTEVSDSALSQGLDALYNFNGPAILVVPEATLVATSESFAWLAKKMLAQCGELQDRVAVLDVYGASSVTQANIATTLRPVIEKFQECVGESFLSYGMAYFPWLKTSNGELLPPSGALAGVFSTCDQLRGVWSAPANIALAPGSTPSLHLTDEQQGTLTFPLNGIAVNTIKEFPARGAVVWGARTFDGNSGDWQHIQVRREMIFLEQSIREGLEAFVFTANDQQTWTAAIDTISTFLNGVWAEGGLLGDKASDAFNVQCGLGSTMTAQDLLDGYMIVQVMLQAVRPGEYMELTFKQKMQAA